jgi:ribosome-binding factor A
MTTRRQERVARFVKEAVSDAIANHLNDPRIAGFVSVTKVEIAADLRSADVYLSIFSKGRFLQGKAQQQLDKNDTGQNKTFAAIMHAKNRIQSLLAGKLQGKFCPVLRFHQDEEFKKTLETMKLIDKAISELEKPDSVDQDTG